MELDSLEKIYTGKVFFIPDYQRGYAWKKEQRLDLIEDLENLVNARYTNPDLMHFTGTIVLKRTPFNNTPSISVSGKQYTYFEVIDGQQRLTTLAILLWCLKEKLSVFSSDPEVYDAIRDISNFIKLGNGSFRLTLNGDKNQHFYKEKVIGNLTMQATTPATNNLENAKHDFNSWLTKSIISLSSEEAKGYYLNLATLITSGLGFLVHEINSHHEVSVIFETMNARGKPLTQFELVKNLLMYQASRCAEFLQDDSIDAFSKRITNVWQHIVETLQEPNPEGEIDEDQFLRFAWAIYPKAHWFLDSKRDGTFDIHRAIKENSKLPVYTRNPKKWLEDFVSHLQDYVEDYRDIVFPKYPNSFTRIITNRDKIVETCTSINRIGRDANLIPLLMAAHHNFSSSSDELHEIFRLVETFSFRLLLLEKYSNTGRSKAFNLAAEIANKSIDIANTKKRIIDDLINYYCSDSVVQKELSNLESNYYEWSGIRYFLYEYERAMARNQQFHLDWYAFMKDEKAKTIEHILPQGEDTLLKVPEWAKSFTHEQWSMLRHSLGNLTLCRPEWNSSLGNKKYSDKRGSSTSSPNDMVYLNSNYFGMKHIAQKWQDWTPESIEERQQELVEFAMKRWRI
jgi:hypothetical protein